MIAGYFAGDGSPYVWCRLTIPGLDVVGSVRFLVDTGSDATILHPDAGIRMGCPFDRLTTPAEFVSAGGTHVYYRELAVIGFHDDESMQREFEIELYVGKPHPVTNGLDSLLGRDVLNRWRIVYDPTDSALEIFVRSADHTMN